MLVQVVTHLLGGSCVAGLRHQGGEDVGAQGVVHHVALQVVAQGADAQLVFRQRPGQLGLAPVADSAEQGGGQHADRPGGDHFLPDFHVPSPWGVPK
ncbi:hypothetical protein FQZ97_1152680 [compost metagenome]